MTMPAQGTPDLLIFRVKPGACLDTPRLRSTRPVEYRPEFRLDMAATMRIGDERAGRRAVQHQLAERAHQEERDDADERVAHQQGRPGAVQPRRRTEEQAGTDRPADGDHLHLATVQTLFVALVLRIQRSGSRRRRAGLDLCHWATSLEAGHPAPSLASVPEIVSGFSTNPNSAGWQAGYRTSPEFWFPYSPRTSPVQTLVV